MIRRPREVLSWAGKHHRKHSAAQNEEGFHSESNEIKGLRTELRNARIENESLKSSGAFREGAQK